jgi:anti-anti-sigma factor
LGAGDRDRGLEMTGLSLEVSSDQPDRVVISVAGEVDMVTAPELAECLQEHPATNVVVDLSRVTFLDSSGITALVHGYNELQRTGHTLRTTNEHEIVLRVLEITGLDAMFHGDPASDG